MLLMKTIPTSSSLVNRSRSPAPPAPDTCSEAESCVVSDMDRLLDIRYAEQPGDGPEELFTIAVRTERNVGQDGWCIKNPGRSSGLPRVSRRPPASTVLRISSCRNLRLHAVARGPASVPSFQRSYPAL
jgi:hypothetical protein